MKRADIIASLIGVSLCGYVFWASGKFPEDNVLLLGPSFFPRLLAWALFFMSIVLLVKALMGKSMESKEKFDIKDPGIQRAGIALLATIVYIFTLDFLGFIIGSTIYLVFLMYLLKLRSYGRMFLISLSVTFIVFAVFRVFLHITLPLGFLG
ncbi:MAG: tripartite tricarboxylate transporter TctB family protein [Bacillota bacterium]